MERIRLSELLGITGTILSITGGIKNSNLLLIPGVVLILIYTNNYINQIIIEKIITPINRNSKQIGQLSKDINNAKKQHEILQRISYLEGKMNNKGQLNINPINLVIFILLVIFAFMILQRMGIF